MALEIHWTTKSEQTFDDIFEYIKTFSEQRAVNFLLEANHIIELISIGNVDFIWSEKEQCYRVPIQKRTVLYYQITESVLELLYFHNTKKDPENIEVH